MQIEQNVSLAAHTSWQVGGNAEYFCQPSSLAQLIEALRFAQNKKIAFSVLSGGSNVLIADQGIAGLTIHLQKLQGVSVHSTAQEFFIEAWAGTHKSELLKIFLQQQLPAALFLAGLPGDVGGGVVMNAGVAEDFLPREFVQIVDWVEVLRPSLQVEKLSAAQMQWGYRHCQGWQPGVIVKVGLRCPLQKDPQILTKVRKANHLRLSKQPLDLPSCGSVFVNPPGHKAAQLIDSCGLKGYTVGGAQVSMRHANFIVNLGGATSQQVWTVIQHVQNTVQQQAKVTLQTEVVRLGQWQDLNYSSAQVF